MRARAKGFLTDKPLPDGFAEWVNCLLSSSCESPLDFETDFNPEDGNETVYYWFDNAASNRALKFDGTFKSESCQCQPKSKFKRKKNYHSEKEGLAWKADKILKDSKDFITMKRHKSYNSAPVGAYYLDDFQLSPTDIIPSYPWYLIPPPAKTTYIKSEYIFALLNYAGLEAVWNVTKNDENRGRKHFTPGMFNILFALFNYVWKDPSQCRNLTIRAKELHCRPFSQACRINLNKEMDEELFATLPTLLGLSPVGSADISDSLRHQVFASLIYSAFKKPLISKFDSSTTEMPYFSATLSILPVRDLSSAWILRGKPAPVPL